MKVRYQSLPYLLYRDDADVEWQVCFADHEKYLNLKTYSDRLEERGKLQRDRAGAADNQGQN
jgi:hypothetical protein